MSPNNKPSTFEVDSKNEEQSPLVQNRNVRVITKHSIIPFKETKPSIETNDLKTIEESYPDLKKPNEENKNEILDMKKTKRLSDVGLGAEELNKLIIKLNVEKKKDDLKEEEHKEIINSKAKKGLESLIITANTPEKNGGSYEFNSGITDPNSPMKQTPNIDSPTKVIQTIFLELFWFFYFKSKTKSFKTLHSNQKLDVCLAMSLKPIKMFI